MKTNLLTPTFDIEPEKEGVIIPKTVVSPLESNKTLNSKEFEREREIFRKYVLAIQSYHKCSFFEAREMLIKARDNQEPIMLDFEYFF